MCYVNPKVYITRNVMFELSSKLTLYNLLHIVLVDKTQLHKYLHQPIVSSILFIFQLIF